MDEGVKIQTLGWVAKTLSGGAAKRGGGVLVKNSLGGHEEREWLGAAIDSRAECSGRLFFALRGEITDGHRFVTDAYASGAIAAIIEDESFGKELDKNGIPYLLVTNSLESLQELARAYRNLLDVRVIAITGSTGKTTTKEYVGRIMKSKFRSFANPGNFNSLIGVPLTILETEVDNEFLICEIGANQLGEIGFLAAMLRPEIGVITNVGDAHVGMFGSVEAIAEAKAELLEHVEAHGYAVLPRDDVFCSSFEKKTEARTVTFGRSQDADYQITNVEPDETGMKFRVNDEVVTIEAVGEYNVLNACAAFTVGDVCGVEHARIREALASVSPLTGRGRVHQKGGVTVVDESYNASPASMRVSVAMLEAMDASRKVAVLGDMKELGKYTEEMHQHLGELLAASAVDSVFWFGEDGRSAKKGFDAAGGAAKFQLYDSLKNLAEEVAADVRAGDAVLVKASRACNLERVVERLLDALDTGSEN
jgi:UDP-N-acetylmuramoyl-tripeptide--D-alanyl-D-alanine ligase